MKNLMLLIALSCGFISCSSQQEETLTDLDCSCGHVVCECAAECVCGCNKPL